MEDGASVNSSVFWLKLVRRLLLSSEDINPDDDVEVASGVFEFSTLVGINDGSVVERPGLMLLETVLVGPSATGVVSDGSSMSDVRASGEVQLDL